MTPKHGARNVLRLFLRQLGRLDNGRVARHLALQSGKKETLNRRRSAASRRHLWILPLAAITAKSVRVHLPKPGGLPPGVTRPAFASKTFARDVGDCVYFKPGYATEPIRRYTVIVRTS